jgi:hypothetical protein
MEVTKIGTNKNIAKKSSTKKSDGPSFSSHLSETQDTSSSSSTSNISSVMAVDSLLALQEIDSDEPRQNKQISRGFDIVEHLDEIRVGLLNGQVSEATLKNLDNLVNNWREADTDGDIKEIIDEIELRAAVELAKLESK